MRLLLGACAATAILVVCAAAGAAGPSPTYQLLQRDVVVNADLWDTKPRMMAANLGFTGIVGVPGLSLDDLATSESTARRAGAAWNAVACPGATLASYTSASTPQQVAASFGYPITLADGLPVEFSWPVRPSTVAPADFEVTLNTGAKVTPALASIYPNSELNERSVVVLFGKFGNRLPPTDHGSVYPVSTSVVAGLQLIGPKGRVVSGIGLGVRSVGTPYADGPAGPRLVAAKLTRISRRGESAPPPFNGVLPNDGVALYGAQARFRLRLYTTGGFSPDGVRAVLPTEFSRYFRLHAGRVVIAQANRTYMVNGFPLRVLGLADLGKKAASYDACYREDKDNYIDIVLGGSEQAARRITSVEIPATGAYSPFYNPGGPGADPTPGVRYTSPGPPQTMPVRIALADPLTVTFVR